VPVKKDTRPLADPTAGMLADSPIVVTSLKPTRDGSRAMIARLFNTSDQSATADFGQSRAKISIANTVDDAIEPVGNTLDFAPHEVKTLRIE